MTGRLTKDTEIQQTNKGIPFIRFVFACKSKTRDESGEQKTDFITCVAWREKAELIHQYCKKGSSLWICGSLGSREFERRDGSKQTTWEVNVEDIEFLSKSEESGEPKAKATAVAMQPIDDIDDDDLPF